MTREEKQKAIDALKISAPIMAVTQEEFTDYIQTLNKIMDWLEQEPKTGHCKDCKYFEYDNVARPGNGIPIIVAHEICSRWGDGCKTSEDGYCFLFKLRESGDKA